MLKERKCDINEYDAIKDLNVLAKLEIDKEFKESCKKLGTLYWNYKDKSYILGSKNRSIITEF